MSNGMIKKIGISVFAQVISLLISFVLNLIVPKYIDEFQYAHWQTFLLYVNYVGVLSFGMLDGILLRYASYSYKELDKSLIKSQLLLLTIGLSVFSFVLSIIALFNIGSITSNIMFLIAVGIISKNIFTFSSYTFQMTNRIKEYALIVIVQRIVYGLFAIILLLLKSNNYIFYCLADLAGDIFAIIVGFFFNKDIIKVKLSYKIKAVLSEALTSIKSGINIMLAVWFSILLISCAKMISQWRWDDIVFGKVTFSFSVSNLFLTFVSAVSIVVFPSLKRMKADVLPQFYISIRRIMTPVIYFAYLLYFPLCLIINLWLPKYSVSLSYFGIILPMVGYSTKISILTDNYLKSYRKENSLLKINGISFLVAITGFLACAYIFNNINMLLLWLVFSMMFRSSYSEIIVTKIIGKDIKKYIILDLIFAVLFEVLVNCLTFNWAFLLYFIFVFVYLFISVKQIKEDYQIVKHL